MMIDSWDGKIFHPRFYDLDTICSYNNSGQIKFDVDIEMAQGYWNTSASRLWTRVRDLFHSELVDTYKSMRGKGLSYENLMTYFYGQQISQIPQKYYNMDYDIKYAPYSQYLGMAHGDGYQHLKRWLKNRLIFTDTLFDYAPSYNNDVLTIRANTTEPMTIEIETYTPVYQHVSWYNGQMDKIKIDGKTAVTFTGTAQTATDQEVLIYGGTNIKRIRGISSMNPNSMLIGSATRLVELEVKDCPILTDINSNKANLSPHTYLNKLDLSNCPQLGGTLRLNNSPLIQEVNVIGTAITDVQMPTSIRNLEILRLPKGITSLTLNDAPLLNTLEFEDGINLQSISLSNCNALENVVNFDLTKTPTVLLDNSYNTEELYMSETTNLTLRNMNAIERLIYIPNDEYETFELEHLTSGKDYSVTTFNCPNLTDFITTAPHRLSYNNCGLTEKIDIKANKVEEAYELSDSRWAGTFIIKSLSEGAISLTNSEKSTDYIEIAPNTECSISTPNVGSHVGIVFFDDEKNIITEGSKGTKDVSLNHFTTTSPSNVKYVVFFTTDGKTYTNTISYYEITEKIITEVKDYGEIKPNITFTANSLDLSNTQFTNIKFLCTTDLYKLKLPTTLKNFYCDSAMDIDTDVIEEASYEVIHDELIEQHTTDYSGEVFRYETKTLTDSSFTKNTGKMIPIDGASEMLGTDEYGFWITSSGWNSGQWISDFMQISENTVCSITKVNDINTSCAIAFCGEDKKIISCYRTENSTSVITLTKTSPVGARYVVFGGGNHKSEYDLSYDRAYTPNIIPSSSDGSLIFSMYTPKLTSEPSTMTWDLLGLKLNDFYTYGMNNDVKPSEDSYIYIPKDIKLITNWTYNPSFGGQKGGYKVISPVIFDEDVTGVTLTANDTICFVSQYSDELCTGQSEYKNSLSFTFGSDQLPYKNVGIMLIGKPTWIKVQASNGNVYMIYPDDLEVVEGGSNITTSDVRAMSSHISNAKKTLQEIQSITMPKRYTSYAIQIKNANITPNNYPTMLYPKLIDTTLPITGKLDYSTYQGTSLAWAYAYTTDAVERIPLSSQNMGQITNQYNKLYGTDFLDVVDVWVYKDTDTSTLETNENIRKAYIELTNDNYTTRIDEVLQYYPNCTDIYLFEDGSVVNLQYMYSAGGHNNAHDTRKQVQNVTFMEGYFNNLTSLMNAFTSCINLVTVNNIPKSVTSFKNCFENCNKFNCQIDLSEFNIASGTLQGTFYNCSSLTYTPTLPSNYAGSMESCFQSCSELVEAPILPDGTTALKNTFNGCSKLTSVSNIPSSCTNYDQTFSLCSSLTSVPQDGWKGNMRYTFNNCTSLNQQINISSASNLESTFNGCTSLSITPNLPSTANCTMEGCFYNCTALISPPITPEGVAKMSNCYRGCTTLTTPANIPISCTNCDSLYYGCTSLTEGSEITEEHNINNINNMYVNCTSLQYVQLPLTADLTGFKPLDGVNSIDIDWIGTRRTDYIVTNLGTIPREEDIHELVPEHLADLAEEGTTATLTLGDYGTYLSPDEVFLANEKGWTIEGASSDFTIVNASDDASALENSEAVISCFIELTNDNYKTRNNEVLQHYPNCTDVYYFDDGSITTLYNMFSGSGGTVQNQITKMVFMEGYFKNITTLDRLTWYNENLRTLDIRGLNSGKVTSMGAMCMSLNNLTELIGFEDFDLSIVNTMRQLMYECHSFNQRLDLSTATSLNSTGLELAFNKCSSLEYTPILPSNYTGSMGDCFNGCSKLVEAPTIPNGVTNLQNCFYNCTSLTTIGNIPSSCNNFYAMVQLCSSLTSVPQDGWKGNMGYTFNNCTSLNQQINISSASNLESTFNGCTSLSITPNLPSTANCTMEGCFYNCTALISPPITPEGVAKMSNCYRGCTAMTTTPNIPTSVTKLLATFYGCTSLTKGAILTKEHNITEYGYMYYSCSSLKSVQILLTAKWSQGYPPLSGCNSLTDIEWIGLSNSNFNLNNLGITFTQADIQKLVPEHLDDLYKDTIKLNHKDTKVTINNNETTYVESARYVEYIEGDGTNYIDTRIYANPQWKYEAVFDINVKGGYYNLFGSDNTEFRLFLNSGGNRSIISYNNVDYNQDEYTVGEKIKVVMDKNQYYVNDELKSTVAENTSTTAFRYSTWIFKARFVGRDNEKPCKMKLYSFKMWDENGTLQFDGRPCLVNEKYPCMYDEVSKKFFFPQS